MNTRFTLAAACLAIAATALIPATATAAPVVRQASGASPAAIQATVDQFRADLGGGSTAGMNGSFGGLRREINWDGVPDEFAGEALFPGGFFNANSPRGAVLATPGVGFVVSAADEDQDDFVRFSNFEPTFETAFATFSPQRLFTPLDSTITDTTFFVPGTDAQATTGGFGVVFTDVDTAGAARLELIGPNGEDLGEFPAPVASGDGGLSFVGVSFDAGERVARARITSGAASTIDLDDGVMGNAEDITQGGPADLVVMDDFIYGEPVALGAVVGDTQAPEVELKGVKRKLQLADLLRGLKAKVSTDEEASLEVSLLASPRRVELAKGKPNLILAAKSLGLGSGTRTVKLKPRRKLLRGADRFKAQLHVLATDAAGNRQQVKRAIEVRR